MWPVRYSCFLNQAARTFAGFAGFAVVMVSMLARILVNFSHAIAVGANDHLSFGLVH